MDVFLSAYTDAASSAGFGTPTPDGLPPVRLFRPAGMAPSVGEAMLVGAHALARSATGIDVDHTGAAGLAGLLQLQRDAAIVPHETGR